MRPKLRLVASIESAHMKSASAAKGNGDIPSYVKLGSPLLSLHEIFCEAVSDNR